ncbi:MAG: metallophosphoesterase family protein [Pseudomonadota bacterium]
MESRGSSGRYLAIGDIHGCRTALETLLRVAEPAVDDVIVTLGDYVDRGPDTAGVLTLILELGASHELVALRGNHEIMMLDACAQQSWQETWLRAGGRETLRSYAENGEGSGTFADIPAAHLDFLANRLQPYYECDTHFFVHANADPRMALTAQSDPNLYWRRYRNPDPHCSGKVMVCGHTTQLTGLPATNGHSICIDTWPYGEGWLTCLDAVGGTIWQANERGQTRTLHVDELAHASGQI